MWNGNTKEVKYDTTESKRQTLDALTHKWCITKARCKIRKYPMEAYPREIGGGILAL